MKKKASCDLHCIYRLERGRGGREVNSAVSCENAETRGSLDGAGRKAAFIFIPAKRETPRTHAHALVCRKCKRNSGIILHPVALAPSATITHRLRSCVDTRRDKCIVELLQRRLE